MVLPARMLPHLITISTPGRTEDDYGNEVLTYDPDEGATVRSGVPAYVRPAGSGVPGRSSENTGDRDAVTSAWQVHCNDLNVTTLDRVTYDEVVYEVDGDPNVWPTIPGGRAGHSKFVIRRVDG